MSRDIILAWQLLVTPLYIVLYNTQATSITQPEHFVEWHFGSLLSRLFDFMKLEWPIAASYASPDVANASSLSQGSPIQPREAERKRCVCEASMAIFIHSLLYLILLSPKLPSPVLMIELCLISR